MNTTLLAIPTLGSRDPGWLRLSIASVRDQPVAGVRAVVVAPPDSPARRVATAMGVEFVPAQRRGLSAAINAAWKTSGADADYLSWLADDDVLSPVSLLAAVDHLDRDPRSVAVYGRLRVIRCDGSTEMLMRPGRLAEWLLPYGTQQVPGVGTLFRATAVRQAGMLDETLRYAMDYDLLLKLRRLGRLAYLPVELAAVRTHPDRLTETRTDGGREVAEVRQRHLAPRQAAAYRRLRWVAAGVDRVYGSVLRRMPVESAPQQLDAVEYVRHDVAVPGEPVVRGIASHR
jgi:GT2 family glycosyltransferase